MVERGRDEEKPNSNEMASEMWSSVGRKLKATRFSVVVCFASGLLFFFFWGGDQGKANAEAQYIKISRQKLCG